MNTRFPGYFSVAWIEGKADVYQEHFDEWEEAFSFAVWASEEFGKAVGVYGHTPELVDAIREYQKLMGYPIPQNAQKNQGE